jgi:hypothetical protein
MVAQVTVTFMVAVIVPPAGTLTIMGLPVRVALVNRTLRALVVEGVTVEERVTLLATPA